PSHGPPAVNQQFGGRFPEPRPPPSSVHLKSSGRFHLKVGEGARGGGPPPPVPGLQWRQQRSQERRQRHQLRSVSPARRRLPQPHPASLSCILHPGVPSCIPDSILRPGYHPAPLSNILRSWVPSAIPGSIRIPEQHPASLVPPCATEQHLESLGTTLRPWAPPGILGYHPASVTRVLHPWVPSCTTEQHPESSGAILHPWYPLHR
ncbi:uncharacterized protein LOC113942494, partial [Corapipo altera]|uniref:uncharacterized protein LOC113942494 n=1 Tax=Corapipo altera TaxID=415028 RepID=UPI000FD6B766